MKNSIFISTNLSPNSGGGNVSKYELEALSRCTNIKLVLANKKYELLPLVCETINPQDYLLPNSPFTWDYLAQEYVDSCIAENEIDILFINGSPFGRTVRSAAELLETVYNYSGFDRDLKVIVDVPAHNLKDSIDEHHKLNYDYERMYPNMVNDFLFDLQTDHVVNADKLIFPSNYSKKATEKLNLLGDQETYIIPHGVNIPEEIKTIPDEFRVGYVGSCGIDKGVHYAVSAWNSLHFKDAVFGYAGSHEDYFDNMTKVIQPQEGALYKNLGWIENISELYNNISVYIQPSVTEGFGLEVLEAMAHGRPVIVSDGAGASEIVDDNACGLIFEKRNINQLMEHIKYFKENPSEIKKLGDRARKASFKYSWENITKKYEEVIE